jgi:hypothetical protein
MGHMVLRAGNSLAAVGEAIGPGAVLLPFSPSIMYSSFNVL